MKKVKAKIIAKHGKRNCPRGNKVGDSFIIDGKTPKGMCCSAFNSIWPYSKPNKFFGCSYSVSCLANKRKDSKN